MILIEIVKLVIHVDRCFQIEVFECHFARGCIAALVVVAHWIVVELNEAIDY
jgi:hypothetical protein